MKKFYALLLVVLTTFLCVSCGGENDEKVIRFTVRSGLVSAALTDLVAEFQESGIFEEHNLDYEIEIDAITGGYDDLRTAIIYDIGSQNAPDLVIGYPDHFAEYFNGGALVNLQEFINDPEVGYTEEEMADFVDSYITENKGYNSTQPDDLYGLPFNKSTEVLIYNKTAFIALFGEENYLSKIPTTWAEVETLGNEIISLVKEGKLDNIWVESTDIDENKNEVINYLKVSDYLKEDSKSPFYPFGYDSSDNAFITLLRQFGGKYTERVRVNKGYTLFNLPENIETTKKMLAHFADLSTRKLFANATTFNGSYCSDAFKIIRCLMTVGSSAGVGYNASDKYPYELAMAPIPYYDGGEGEPVKYVIQQGTNIAMLNHNTEEKRLACWLFMKYLLEPANTAKFAIATGGYLPVRESAYETDLYKEFLTNPTADKVHYSQVAHVALDYLNEGYTFFVDDAFVGSAKIRSESGAIFDSVVILHEDAEARIKSAVNTLGGSFIKPAA